MTTTERTARRIADPAVADDPFGGLVDLAGLLGAWCDRNEHLESADRDELLAHGIRLRAVGLAALAEAGLDPLAAYGARLRHMEHKNALRDDAEADPADAVATAGTWRRLQLVQARHDRLFHQDVVGLPKNQQLQHYTLHLAKLARYRMLAGRSAHAWADWAAGRVADPLIFGVKLATVTNYRLPDEPVA